MNIFRLYFLVRYTLSLGVFFILIGFWGSYVFSDTDMRFARNISIDTSEAHCVLSIIQDRYGFIWVGTDRGLSRFDGYSFLECPLQQSAPDSLFGSAPVECMAADSGGKLWIGTRSGLSLFDPESGKLGEIKYLPSGNRDIYSHWVQTARTDRAGRTWIGTQAGLFVLDKYKQHMSAHFTNYGKSVSQPRNIQAITEDNRGNIWIGSDHGISLYDERTKQLRDFRPPEVMSGKKLWVHAIVETGKDSLCLSTSRGLELFTPSKGFFRILHPLPQTYFSRSLLYDDNTKRLWMATDEGIVLYHISTGTAAIIRNDPDDPSSLSSDHVRAVFRDRSGNMWIGTEGGGLNKLVVPDITLSPQLFLKEASLPGKVTCFYESSSSILWIGAENGLFRQDGTRHSPISSLISDSHSLKDVHILSIGEDSKGCIWFGTAKGGLYRFDPKRNNLDIWRHNNPSVDSLSVFPVNAILRDTFDRLWFGTDQGLFVNNQQSGDVKIYRRNHSESISLGDDQINGLFDDKSGNVWIANRTRGLSRFDRKLNYFVHYQHNSVSPSSLSSNNVFQVTVDSRGKIWAGTADGANWLKQKSEYFVHIDGLRGKKIKAILEDSAGVLWMNLENGLAKVYPESNALSIIDLGGEEKAPYHFTAMYRRKDDRILLGSEGGYYEFQPSFKTYPASTSIPMISSVEYGGKKRVFPCETAIPRIDLAENAGSIAFEFFSPDYVNGSGIRYMYRLKGYDSDWRESAWGERRAVYPNLMPGNYRFAVRVSQDGSLWKENPASITIRVNPLFYHTLLFKSLLIAFFPSVFALFILARARTKELERARLLSILEHMPGLVLMVHKSGAMSFANRMVREARYVIDPRELPHPSGTHNVLRDWSSKNGRIYDISMYPFHAGEANESILYLAFDISERKEMERMIAESHEQCRLLVDNLQEKIEYERKRISREIHDDLGQILTMIKMEIGWISMFLPEGMKNVEEKTRAINDLIVSAIESMRKICEELRPAMIDTLGLIPAIQAHAESFQKRTGIRCHTQMPEPESLEMDSSISITLFRMVQESLTNIIRHSKATEVRIVFSYDDYSCSLTIYDNGIGLDTARIGKNGSLGIVGMRERVLSFGGEFHISGEHGNGTQISAILPQKYRQTLI